MEENKRLSCSLERRGFLTRVPVRKQYLDVHSITESEARHESIISLALSLSMIERKLTAILPFSWSLIMRKSL
jgi:hypothetical protein